MGVLTVKLLSADNMKGEDGLFNRSNDLSVVVHAGNERQKTKLYEGASARDVQFEDEVFQFNINRFEMNHRNLEFKLKDKDFLDSDDIGEAKIDMEEAAQVQGFATLQVRPKGQLSVELFYQDAE
jgi:Ca2+-dependent lipid-binding protein